MSVTFSPNDILSNQTRPTATPSPSSASSAPVTFNADDVVSNQTQAAKAAPVAVPPPEKSKGQKIWDAIVHPENSGTSSINLGSQGADAPQSLPANSAPGTVTQGMEKGLTSTLGGVSKIMGGPGAEPQETNAKGPAEWTGDALESLAEFYAGDASFRALGVGEKLKTLGDVAKVLKDHPVLARLAATGANALRQGTVAGVQSYARGASPTDAATTGALTAGTGAVLENVVAPVASAAKKLITGAGEGVEGAPTPFQRINPFRKPLMSPKALGAAEAQPPAQAAIRTAIGAPSTAPIIKDNTTIYDQPLKDVYGKMKAAYKTMDDAVGFDLKAEKLALDNDQDKLTQLGNTDADNAARVKLKASIADSTQRISDAESKLKIAGIDPKAGDVLYKAQKAGEQFKSALVNSTNPDGTVEVDALLKRSQKLRFRPKYGDRLAQAFGQGDEKAGKVIADKFMNDLQEAQKTGKQFMTNRELRNNLIKWGVPGVGAALGAAGTVYELSQ